MDSQNNPYKAPESNVEQTETGLSKRYMGFWPRVAASIVDNILILIITMPLLYLLLGKEYFFSDVGANGIIDIVFTYVLPAVAVVVFWMYKQATPGKMMFSAKIVDEKTGDKPTIQQWLVRYIGYIPSTLVLGLGFFWIIWDKKKQGWHDKMAGTIVVYHG